MTRATTEGLSESRQLSRWRICSREGVHVRGERERFDDEIRERLIELASSNREAFIYTHARAHAQRERETVAFAAMF